MFLRRLVGAALTVLYPLLALASTPPPSQADVRYGPDAGEVLDLWIAPAAATNSSAPIVVYIHGGGFTKGDKSQVRESKLIRECLAAGVSFAAINYPLAPKASLPEILRDCGRAVQFIRAQGKAWQIDPTRLAVYGSSAGAGTALWLAFHVDLADPKNTDPVLRESTRPTCAASVSGQFSYDFVRWHELFGDELIARYGRSYLKPAFYGLPPGTDLLGPAAAKVRADCDVIGLMTKNAPPILVSSSLPNLDVETATQFLHHPTHSQRLYQRAQELGLSVVGIIPALGIAPSAGEPSNLRDFLFTELRVKATKTLAAPQER